MSKSKVTESPLISHLSDAIPLPILTEFYLAASISQKFARITRTSFKQCAIPFNKFIKE
jgi:hypothetical protein